MLIAAPRSANQVTIERMKTVIQRVKYASVSIDGKVTARIDQGLMILLGIADDDDREAADWLARKAAALRIFDDENGVMNKDIQEIDGQILVVSQFTLLASYKKGNRPSYIHAALRALHRPTRRLDRQTRCHGHFWRRYENRTPQ